MVCRAMQTSSQPFLNWTVACKCFFCKKLWPCRWLYRKKNLQFDWQPNMIKPLNWGSYRHRQCCYHCNAISYVQDGQPEEDLLYTNWGRGAEYRRQQLSASSCHVCMASRCSQRCVGSLCFNSFSEFLSKSVLFQSVKVIEADHPGRLPRSQWCFAFDADQRLFPLAMLGFDRTSVADFNFLTP